MTVSSENVVCPMFSWYQGATKGLWMKKRLSKWRPYPKNPPWPQDTKFLRHGVDDRRVCTGEGVVRCARILKA